MLGASTNFLIAVRFLLSRKRSMIMSLIGIVFGVAFFIVTQAQTSGFEQFFIRTMLGVNGALRVEDKIQQTMRSMEVEGGTGFQISMEDGVDYVEGVEYPDDVMDAVQRFAEVVSVAEVLRGSAQRQFQRDVLQTLWCGPRTLPECVRSRYSDCLRGFG